MILLFSSLFFIFGLAVGSFLNVVAYRSVHGDPKRPELKKPQRSSLEKISSVLFGHSVCPKCRHQLSALDLVPILSYVILKGRCRTCRKKISLQYPIVEFATGLLFAFTFYHWYQTTSFQFPVTSGQANSGLWSLVSGPWSLAAGNLIYLIYLLFVISVLIVLFTTDIVDNLLPNSIVLPAIAVVIIYKLLLSLFSPPPFFSLSSLLPFLTDFAASFLVASIFFAIVYLSRERALGGGDVKLVFLISLVVGWPSLLVALWLAFLTGGAVAVMLILLGKKRFGQTVPLGPFLALGALVAMFYGNEIIRWYLSTLAG